MARCPVDGVATTHREERDAISRYAILVLTNVRDRILTAGTYRNQGNVPEDIPLRSILEYGSLGTVRECISNASTREKALLFLTGIILSKDVPSEVKNEARKILLAAAKEYDEARIMIEILAMERGYIEDPQKWLADGKQTTREFLVYAVGGAIMAGIGAIEVLHTSFGPAALVGGIIGAAIYLISKKERNRQPNQLQDDGESLDDEMETDDSY
jgi:hypothetical protein